MSEFVKPPLPQEFYWHAVGWETIAEQLQARDAELLRAVADWIEAATWMPVGQKLAAELRKAAEQ